MNINIKVTDGFNFDPIHLETYEKVNSVKERFPFIYAYEKTHKIYHKIVNLKDINIPGNMNQLVRVGDNPSFNEMQVDITNKGYCLDNLGIILTNDRSDGYQYGTVDGVTKLSILSHLGVKNAVVTIIEDLSKADRLILGLKLNTKGKPFGKATLNDIKKVIVQLYALGKVKSNGITLEASIKNQVGEIAGHLSKNVLNEFVSDIAEVITETPRGHDNLRTPSDKQDRLKDLGLINTPQTVYVPVGAFFEKAVTVGLNAYRKYAKYYDNDDIEIRLIVDGGVLDSENPLDDWKKKCMNFKDQYNNYVRGISKIHFDDLQPSHSKVCVYGAMPQVEGVKNIPMDKLYKL